MCGILPSPAPATYEEPHMPRPPLVHSIASLLLAHQPRDTIALTLLHNGAQQTVSVTLAQTPR